MKRIPLWITLIPLAIGLAVYWWYWDAERDAFEAALQPVFGEGRAPVNGFPYRLEAQIAHPRWRRDGQYVLDLRADGLVVNRQPWREGLTFARALAPSVSWEAPGLGARFSVRSPTAQASLHVVDGRITRLSVVHPDAQLTLPIVPVPATAASFEWHFRETPASPDPASRAPTFPEQAQVVLSGEGLRFRGGDPLTFEAQIGVTSAAAIWDLASWRRGGTAELRRLSLADGKGEVVTVVATASASLSDPLRILGTIETVCPESVQALFAGAPMPAREYRARRPVTFSFGGTADDLRLMLPAGAAPKRPVRAQEAPCPRLVG